MRFHRVPPGECGFTSSDGDPGTNGVISKTRCGACNKDHLTRFASVFSRARHFGVRGHVRAFEGDTCRRTPKIARLSVPSLLLLDDFARLFAGRSRSFREMRRKHLAGVSNCVHQRVRESFVTKMFAHTVDNLPPINVAASFVGRLIAHDCEFARAGGDKNEDAIAFACLVHSKPLKFLLCRNQRIAIQLPTLDTDADLRGGFRFSLANRLHDSVVLELAQKLFCSHSATSSSLLLRRQNFLLHR
jgi:hypothetical protein